MTDFDDEEKNPPSGPDGVDDIWVGDDGNYSYDSLGEIQRIYDALSEVMADIESRDEDGENVVVLKPEERSLLLEFHVVVHAHLERISSIILFETIGRRKTHPAEIIDFFREEFSQSKREDLLYKTGTIDEGLKSEMSKVRDIRNKIVHSQSRRMYIDPDRQSMSDVDRAKETVEKVESILEGVMGNHLMDSAESDDQDN